MRTIVACALLGCLLSACGDDGAGAGDADAAIDAPLAIDAPPLPSTCSTDAQDCPDGFKCSLVIGMTQPPIQRRCVPLAGAVQEGGACAPATTPPMSGHDTCAEGLFCHQNVCRRLCTSSAVCGADQACTQYATANDGLCRDRCVLVTAGECPSGETCDSFQTLDSGAFESYCRPVGTQPQGASCFAGYCGLDQGCDRDANCAPICNADHPCTSGTCDLAPLQSDYGTCRAP